jgi:hypothetical protein
VSRNPLAAKAPVADTSHQDAEVKRVHAQAEERAKAERRQAALSIQGCAEGEWDAARKRADERKRRIRRAYR